MSALSIAFETTLLLSILLACTWFGMLYFVATVAMPGFGAVLPDKDFLKAFKAIDNIFQGQIPLFVKIPLFGSVLVLIAATVLGALESNNGNDSVYTGLLYAALVLYIISYITTFRFNIPLNNTVQALDMDNMSDAEWYNARLDFEAPWNFWNIFRVVAELVACICLILVLFFYERDA